MCACVRAHVWYCILSSLGVLSYIRIIVCATIWGFAQRLCVCVSVGIYIYYVSSRCACMDALFIGTVILPLILWRRPIVQCTDCNSHRLYPYPGGHCVGRPLRKYIPKRPGFPGWYSAELPSSGRCLRGEERTTTDYLIHGGTQLHQTCSPIVMIRNLCDHELVKSSYINLYILAEINLSTFCTYVILITSGVTNWQALIC